MRVFSLGTRLALIILAGTLASVGSVLAIAYTALVEDFEAILTKQQLFETQRLADSVDEKLQLRVRLLSEFATSLVDGERLVPGHQIESLMNRQILLNELFPGGLIILDDNAVAIHESFFVPHRIGTYYGDRQHFRQVISSRKPVISRPIIGRTTGIPLLSFSVPVESGDGDLLGIVAGAINLGETSLLPVDSLRSINQDDAVFVVIDSDNFMYIEGNTRVIQAGQPLPDPGQDPLIDAALSGLPFGRLSPADGEPMIYATSYLDSLGWQFVRAVPYEWATAPARASFLRFFGVSLVIALFIAMVSFAVSRSATGRLDRMTRRIERMVDAPSGSGRLDETGPPEVRDLARAFNRLQAERDANAQMQESFVSNVSHELRTPLTATNGALRLVHGGATGELPAKAREMIGVALRNVERLQLLISDLLDFSKLSSGQMSVALKATNLHSLCESAISGNQGMVQDRQLQLISKVDPALTVTADPHRLRQILDNFISNAAKFSPRGGRIEIAADIATPGRVRLAVRDQGPGVPKHFEPQLFSRFAQAEAGTTRSVMGTGLGLAICRELTELMGGQIGYRYNEGAEFWVELPAVDAEASVDHEST